MAKCWGNAGTAFPERSGSFTKGRTPNIRYFVAKLSIVAIYALFERISQSFLRKSCCIGRAFNESQPAFAVLSKTSQPAFREVLESPLSERNVRLDAKNYIIVDKLCFFGRQIVHFVWRKTMWQIWPVEKTSLLGRCINFGQGGRGWLALVECSRIPQSFCRARIRKFLRQQCCRFETPYRRGP